MNEEYYDGDTLGYLDLFWYSEIRSETTVEVCNCFKHHADAGEVIFYDIYSDEEKAADPSKRDTGIFFFCGNPGARFALCNSGILLLRIHFENGKKQAGNALVMLAVRGAQRLAVFHRSRRDKSVRKFH